MPTLDEIAALLPRDAWIALGSTLGLLFVRFVTLCLRRKPKEPNKGDALIGNLLQKLRLSALNVNESWVETTDGCLFLGLNTGSIKANGEELQGLLTRRQRRRLFREALHIASAWRAAQMQARLDAAVRRTTPFEMRAAEAWLPSDARDLDAG